MSDLSISRPVFDVVIPNNNEQEFIATAISLDYKEIVFLSSNINYSKPASNDIVVKSAYLLKDQSLLQRARKNFDYVFADAERKFFELKIDYIIGIEMSDRKDSFHFKSTRLNQVHAELSKTNNISMVFDFSALIHSPIMVLGKMFQNALLIKKYGLDYTAFSLATDPLLMRSRSVLLALESVLKL